MNLKALHHYLTTLSPSEEKYRNGYVYDGWKDMPRKQCNGVEYTHYIGLRCCLFPT